VTFKQTLVKDADWALAGNRSEKSVAPVHRRSSTNNAAQAIEQLRFAAIPFCYADGFAKCDGNEMKFLHAADLHLDSPLGGLERYEGAPVDQIRGATRKALENLVELAICERVDFVVIAGDLYDGDWRDYNTGMFFVNQMQKLCSAGVRLYLIAGNHDAVSTMTRKLQLPRNPEGDSVMLSSELPETRRIEDLGVAIHGRSFANQAETRNMVLDYPVPVGHWFNLGLLHTSLNGSEEHDTYAPCTPADLRSKGYDYWALGHIHKRSLLPCEGSPLVAPYALYSGNIQGRNIRETGPRGCFLVSVDDKHRVDVEFRPLDVFRWEVCPVVCPQTAELDDVLEQFRVKLCALVATSDRPLGIRVRIEGPTEVHQELNSHRSHVTAEIRSMATAVSGGSAWIEQVKFATRDSRETGVASLADGPLGELEKYLDEIPQNEQALAQLVGELKDLARKLPGELMRPPDGLLLGDPAWVLEMVRDLKPMLMERFKKPPSA
jgi:exonuclease SbcD